jgi:hypothetical protein
MRALVAVPPLLQVLNLEESTLKGNPLMLPNTLEERLLGDTSSPAPEESPLRIRLRSAEEVLLNEIHYEQVREDAEEFEVLMPPRRDEYVPQQQRSHQSLEARLSASYDAPLSVQDQTHEILAGAYPHLLPRDEPEPAENTAGWYARARQQLSTIQRLRGEALSSRR